MQLLLLFQDSGILSPYIDAAIKLWPIWVVIVVGVGALVRYRAWEKSGISDTNRTNIDAMRSLLETRDTEIEDAEQRLGVLRKESGDTIAKLEKDHGILESEYKTLAGLVISELIGWAARYDYHVAEMQSKDSQIRILETRIGIMEQREAENSAIHKSQ